MVNSEWSMVKTVDKSDKGPQTENKKEEECADAPLIP